MADLNPTAQEFRPTTTKIIHSPIPSPPSPLPFLHHYYHLHPPYTATLTLPLLQYYQQETSHTPQTTVSLYQPCQTVFLSYPYFFDYQYINTGGVLPDSSSPSSPHFPLSVAPTRSILLTSLPHDVTESLITKQLETFGDVRCVEASRIDDGIVTVHFYDLRHAELALKVLREQNLRLQNISRGFNDTTQRDSRGFINGRVVWAQFVIPSVNAVNDGVNQGTLVVFNLNPNVSSTSLRKSFETFGPVKELRETPLKKQQRFVEFYDVRDASKALAEMDGKVIQGKRINLKFSRRSACASRFITYNTRVDKNDVVVSKGHKYIEKDPVFVAPIRRRFCGRLRCLNLPPRSIAARLQLKMVGVRKHLGNGVTENLADANYGSESNWNGSLRQQSKYWQRRVSPGKRFLISEGGTEGSGRGDMRTTLMIKNIPNRFSQELFLNLLDNHCIHSNEHIVNADNEHQPPCSSYDFFYLPIDFKNKCNVGYGFVNMTSPEAARRFYKAFHNHQWEVFNSRKTCEVTYARVQGLKALKKHFKHSKISSEADDYLPVLFSPPRDGKRLTKPVAMVGV